MEAALESILSLYLNFKLLVAKRFFHFFIVWLIISHITALNDNIAFLNKACLRFRVSYRDAVAACYEEGSNNDSEVHRLVQFLLKFTFL